MVTDDVPRVAIGIAIIWFGVVLLRGKKDVTVVTQDKKEESVIQIEQRDDSQVS